MGNFGPLTSFSAASFYALQPTITSLRAAAILTNSYVGSTALDISMANQVAVLLDFTIGSLTSLALKFQVSDDNSAWKDCTIDNTGSGSEASDEFIYTNPSDVRSYTASCNKCIYVPVKGRWFRVALKGVGTLTNSSATLGAYAGAA